MLDPDGALAQRAWNLANDALRTIVYVRHSAETVAAACIYIAARQLAVALPEEPQPWWTLFDVHTDDLDDAGVTILDLYELGPPTFVDLTQEQR